MKSKAFILRQIGELLEKNRGMCEQEIEDWIKENDKELKHEEFSIQDYGRFRK